MSVTKEQLPELIAAAVKRAIEKKQLTDNDLRAIEDVPVTIGIVPAQPAEPKERRVTPTHPLGVRIIKLDDLRDQSKLEPIE